MLDLEIERLRRLTQKDPQNHDLQLQLGIMLYGVGRVPEAYKILSSLKKIDPLDIRVHRYLQEIAVQLPNLKASDLNVKLEGIAKDLDLCLPLEIDSDEECGKDFDGYRIITLLKRKPLSRVYKAEHRFYKDYVTIEIFSYVNSRCLEFVSYDSIQHFFHPGILETFEFLTKNEKMYIASEYLWAESLESIIKRKGAIPKRAVIDISIQITDSLVCLHQKRYVHPELTASNIFISPQGRAKISYPHIFSPDESRSSRSNIRKRHYSQSPLYFPPEAIWDSGSIDCRSNIYSLGTIMYHMLTGSSPYQENNRLKLISHVFQKGLEFPENKSNSSLYDIIRKMTQKTPEMRYSTPMELLESLRALE